MLTPQQPQALPQVRQDQVRQDQVRQDQVRQDDGYIYPADGSSNEARYPAPPSRRVYDTQVYGQPQQQYYANRGYAPAPQGYYRPQPQPYYQPRGLFTYQD